MHNLAYTLKQLGKIPDALTPIKKCANLRNKLLGSDHPDTISSFDALGDWETAVSHLSKKKNNKLQRTPFFPCQCKLILLIKSNQIQSLSEAANGEHS